MDIITIRLGFDRSYVLKGDCLVVVDCGLPGKAGSFARGLEAENLSPRDVELIILTHGHYDHVGSACDIREMTGAKTVMHHLDADWLEEPTMPAPPGITAWGKLFMSIRRFVMPVERVKPAPVDIRIGDEDWPLGDYGIQGRVVWTPGHTMGSVSVVLDSGDALVGDLAMNMFPLTLRPGLPIFAEDARAVVSSWRKLFEMGVHTVWPAHGKPFPASVMRRATGGLVRTQRGDR